MNSKQILFQLIRAGLGTDAAPSDLDGVDWQEVIDIADKHGVYAVAWDGLQSFYRSNPHASLIFDRRELKHIKYDWFGRVLQCEIESDKADEKCRSLYDMYVGKGFQCCILKGQGVARYYPVPIHRSLGDIDLWVRGERDKILDVARNAGAEVSSINVKHADAGFFDDFPVELHFTPGFLFSPITNRRLQRWFAGASFCFDDDTGFAYPSLSFNLVFLMFHIYHHVFDGGVGLKQITDYCCALMHSEKEQREQAFETVKRLKMGRFCSGLMWVMQEIYGLDGHLLLCEPCEKEGKFLINEFMNGAGFGRHDTRLQFRKPRNLVEKGFQQFFRNCRFLGHYPSEVLWAPFWKVWHWCWRLVHGYLHN